MNPSVKSVAITLLSTASSMIRADLEPRLHPRTLTTAASGPA